MTSCLSYPSWPRSKNANSSQMKTFACSAMTCANGVSPDGIEDLTACHCLLPVQDRSR